MILKCGFVAILGAPNVGKSTLVNRLVGSKVSIVSRKVQTTRQRVLGIMVHGQTQIILIDTPGVFDPKRSLETAMVNAAWGSLKGADLILVMADASRQNPKGTLEILERVKNHPAPKILVLNKVDLIKRENLLERTSFLTEGQNLKNVFMVSAKEGDGLSDLLTTLSQDLPEGPWLYPEDQMSDLPLRSLAAEVTREKVFHYLHQELPYEIAVETERWEEFENGDVKISQVIHVNRDNQKKIVLGKGGHQVKRIGEVARKELSQIFGTKVHLILHVKVTKDWVQKSPFWKRLYGNEI